MTGPPTGERDTATARTPATGVTATSAGTTSAGDVARRLGIAVTTLRTWDQRYGVGPSRHSPGRHRRYTEADVARLELMVRLTARGLPAAAAARTALAQDRVPDRDERGDGDRVRDRDPVRAPTVVRDGGGHTVAVGRRAPAARGLARAAMRLDTLTMNAIIATAIGERGVVGTWDDVLRPVLAGLGQRHASTGGLIEVEHLLSRCVSEAFAAVPRPTDRARPPRLLLACAAEEQHSLPIEALAAALAECDVPTRLLGSRVPAPALAEAIRRTRPTAVVVWSHAASTGDLDRLLACLPDRHRPLLVAAGPGWSDLRSAVEPAATAPAATEPRAINPAAVRPAVAVPAAAGLPAAVAVPAVGLPAVERPADLAAAVALLRPLARG